MIVFMRHGRIVVPKGTCIGRTDIPLSDTGCEQAEDAAAALRHIRFGRICSSPAQRARATLMPLACGYGEHFEIVEDINEINMGEWEGLSFDYIRSRYAEAYAERGCRFASFRPPGGESFDDVAGRAMKALAGLAGGPLPVLAVTHAGVIRSVLCRVTNHPLDDLFHFTPEYAHCTLLRPVGGALELVAENVSPDNVGEYL